MTSAATLSVGDITLTLPSGGISQQLNQIVTIGGAAFRFTEIEARGSEFVVKYIPANQAAESEFLVAPQSSGVMATDDLGVAHKMVGAGGQGDEGHRAIYGEIAFEGTLPANATRLTLYIQDLIENVPITPVTLELPLSGGS